MKNVYLVLFGAFLLLSNPGSISEWRIVEEEADFTISLYTQENSREVLTTYETDNIIRLENLNIGDHYTIHFNVYDVLIATSFDAEQAEVIASNNKTWQIVPKYSSVEFELELTGNPNLPAQIHVSISNHSHAERVWNKKQQSEIVRNPPTIYKGEDETYLVRDVFIQTSCFDVSNVSFSGNSDLGKAEFVNASTFEFKRGIILSNFDADQVVGPNVQSGTGGVIGGGSDPDLLTLIQQNGGSSSNDAQVLTFDFVPTVDQVTFNYVFGSEEYCDFAGGNSPFTDVFGFFVSGPGINGPFQNNAENIALTPGTNDPITVATINWTTNSEYYITNDVSNGGGQCDPAEIAAPPHAPDDLELDGWTTKLTAVADVIPCETYTIKLAISDATDAIYGSAVFLEAKSFFFGDGIDFEVVYTPGDAEFVYEECGLDEACIVFTRPPGSPDTLDVYIPITENPLSEAIEGVDYNELPDTIVFPAGQDEVEFCLEVINDTITEGIESVIFIIENVCDCGDPEITIYINEVPPFEGSITGPDTICSSQQVNLEVFVNDSVPPAVVYEWSNGSPLPTMQDFITETTVYSVTVTDGCGRDTILEHEVYLNESPSGTLTGEGNLCANSDSCAILIFEFTGEGPWDIEYRRNGISFFINNIVDEYYEVEICEPGNYTFFSIFDNSGCDGLAFGNYFLQETEVEIEAEVTDALCYGEASGSINVTIDGGDSPYEFVWDPPQGGVEDPTDLEPGEYTLIVTEDGGCTAEMVIIVGEADSITITAIEITPVNCDGPESGAINITVEGGTAPYEYDWSDPAEDVEDPMDIPLGEYTVTITDENGCEYVSAVIVVIPDDDSPMANAGEDLTLTCDDPLLVLQGSGDAPMGPPLVMWTADPGNIVSGEDSFNPIIDEPGIYTITVSNADGTCPVIDMVEVIDDTDGPELDAGEDMVINCFQSIISLDGSTDPLNEILWTTQDGNIVAGELFINPVVDAPGTYVMTVENPENGCISVDSVMVTLDTDAPVIDIVDPDSLTCSQFQILIDGSGSTSGPNITYQWNTQNGNIVSDDTLEIITVDGGGEYTLILTNDQNGCADTAVVSVPINIDTFDINIASIDPLNCIVEETIIDGSGSEQSENSVILWETQDGEIISGENTPIVTVGGSGSYTITILDTITGCMSSQVVMVDEEINDPGAEAGVADQLTCAINELQLDGSADLQGPNITYMWTTQDGNIVSGGDSENPTISLEGTYVLEVTDENTGCTSLDSVTVLASEDIPEITVISDMLEITCNDSILTIDIDLDGNVDDFIIEWETQDGNIVSGNNSENPVVDMDGNYQVTIVDTVLGCEAIANVQVMLNIDEPDANAGSIATLTCDVTSLDLDGSLSESGPDISYEWETQDGNIVSGGNTQTPVIDEPGEYTIIVTDESNGCTSEASVIIDEDTEAPFALVDLPELLTCDVLTTILNAGPTGNDISYEWSTMNGNIVSGGDTQNPTIDEPGNYTVIVTNELNGCSSEAFVQVDQNIEAPTADAGQADMLTCNISSISLDGSGSSSGPEITYEWSTMNGNIVSGENTIDPEVDEVGVYELLVTDEENGCTAIAVVEVEADQNTPIATLAIPDEINCANSSIVINGDGSSNGGSFDIFWINQAGDTVAQNVTELEVMDAGEYTIVVVNTDNDCVEEDMVTVTLDTTAPAINLANYGVITCDDASILLDASNSDNGPNFEYEWQVPGGDDITGQDQINAETEGTYILTITNTDNQCKVSLEIPVQEDTEAPEALILNAPELNCYNSNVSLEGSSDMNGPDISYNWTTQNGNILGLGNEANILIDQAGTYTLEVTNDDNGCSSISTIIVEEDYEEPTAIIADALEINCDNDFSTLDATGSSEGAGFTYEWNTVTGQIVDESDPLGIVVSAGGVYELIITNEANGCMASAFVTVNENRSDPTALIQSLQPDCGDSLGTIRFSNFNGVPPFIVSIDGGVTFTENYEYANLPAGQYNLAFRDGSGCTVYESSEIISKPQVLAHFAEVSVTIDYGGEIQLEVILDMDPSLIESIVWSPEEGLSCIDCLNPIASPERTTVYGVTITAFDGCDLYIQIPVIVDERPDIYIPNIFSPNGDSNNDRWTVFGNDEHVIEITELRVFDRWGNMVYHTVHTPVNDLSIGWDGSFKGEVLNPGVFTYFLEVELNTGKVVFLEGDVTLIR